MSTPYLTKEFCKFHIFQRFETIVLHQITDSFLTKLVELPSFSNVSQELFVPDQLPQNSKPQSFRLIPKANAEAYFENNSEIDTANKISEITDIQNGVALTTVLSEWKGLTHSPKSSF